MKKPADKSTGFIYEGGHLITLYLACLLQLFEFVFCFSPQKCPENNSDTANNASSLNCIFLFQVIVKNIFQNIFQTRKKMMRLR